MAKISPEDVYREIYQSMVQHPLYSRVCMHWEILSRKYRNSDTVFNHEIILEAMELVEREVEVEASIQRQEAASGAIEEIELAEEIMREL